MNGNGGEMILEVADTIRKCQRRLWNSRLPQDEGIYKFGKFVVKSPFLYSGRRSSEFKFWKSGDFDSRIECSFYENDFSFLIIGKQGNTVITSDVNANLMIHKIMKISTDQVDTYPYVGFTWTREERRGVPKETLSSLRFTLNSSTFVQYDYKDGEYKVMNHKNIPLSDIELPEDLNEVTEIRGVSFEKRIDSDSVIRKIVMESDIRELSDEINQVTG